MDLLAAKRKTLGHHFREGDGGPAGDNTGGTGLNSGGFGTTPGGSGTYNPITGRIEGGPANTYTGYNGNVNVGQNAAMAAMAKNEYTPPASDVTNMTDSLGRPIFSGETGRSLLNGSLSMRPDGSLTTTNLASDATHTTTGLSFKDLRAGLDSGLYDPNAMMSPTQTYGQAMGINDYVKPAMQGIQNLTMMAMPTPMSLLVKGLANYDKTGDIAGAITGTLKDYGLGVLGGKLTGQANSLLSKELGRDTMSAVNQGSAIANAFGAGIPTVGGFIGGQLKGLFGGSGLTTNATTNTQGNPITTPVSYSSGHSNSLFAPQQNPLFAKKPLIVE
jgi:hypothetical protein